MRVKEESANFDITTLYSAILHFYKRVIQDEPYLLKKMSLGRVNDPDTLAATEPLGQLVELRDQLIKMGLGFGCEEAVDRVLVEEMKDWRWAKGLQSLVEEGGAVHREMEGKKKSKEGVEPS